MESVKVTNQAKQLLNVTRNDEIIPAIKAALEPPQIQAPVTVTLTFISGHVLASVSGVSSPPTAQQIGLIQAICRRHADGLEEQRMALVTTEIRAAIEAETADE